MSKAVSLKLQGTAGIIGHIILNMMHGHMMNKIRFWCMAKKRANTPYHPGIDPAIRPFKKLTVTNIMKHEAKSSFVIQLRDITIRYVNQPPLPSIEHRSIKENCNGDN